MKKQNVGACGVLLAGLAMIGCNSQALDVEPDGADSASPGVFSVALTVPNKAGLPACTGALVGTTAFVASPASLWSCQAGSWFAIPCTNLLAGAVAYASATKTLWACVSGQWGEITLATGPQGPQGAPGPQGIQGATGLRGERGADGGQGQRGDVGPAGPAGGDGQTTLVTTATEPEGGHCAAGGVRIDVGLDEDADGTLDPSEIQQTTFVCNGSDGAPVVCVPVAEVCDDAKDNDCDGAVDEGCSVLSIALNETDTAAEANFCLVDYPFSLSLPSGSQSPMIHGAIGEGGVTDGGGAPVGVRGQVGYGPPGTDPRTEPGWVWSEAHFTSSLGDLDEFQGSFAAPALGEWRYAYRFALNGQGWTYCDNDGAGSSTGYDFSVSKLPQMLVQ